MIGLTVPEAADRLGMGATKVYLMVADGRIESGRECVGGRSVAVISEAEVARIGQPGPVVYTTRELAEILRTSAVSIKRKIHSGDITAETRTGVGGTRFVITEEEAARLLAEGF